MDFNIGGRNSTDLSYVDDISTPIYDSIINMKHSLAKVNNACLHLATKKTKVMIICMKLEHFGQFRYLGSIKTYICYMLKRHRNRDCKDKTTNVSAKQFLKRSFNIE